MYTPPDFVPGFRPHCLPADDALWFVVNNAQLLVTEGETPALPTNGVALSLQSLSPPHYFGCLGTRDCLALNIEPDTPAPPGYCWVGLRSLFMLLPEAVLAVAGRATQIVEWDRSHRFCGRCGSPTQQKEKERVKVCVNCGHTAYPRVSPCMMVLVRREQELLLARAPHYPPGRYSALAGFVEPGESLEETVRREVREEVGVEVSNLRYFGSQSWPFPHQLMVAFHADYAGGELTPDPVEIADAQWFTLDRLPKLPPRLSISRHLIEAAVAELRAGQAAHSA